jgi:hypothetical protein
MGMAKQHRPLHEIAREIQKDWANMSPHAKPYHSAMATMDSVHENFGLDPGREIVMYFLSNASTWKGETARRIKKELKEILA